MEAALAEGKLDGVIDKARMIGELGQRYGDANLLAEGVLFEGRALVRRGQMTQGLALLDEAMVAVLSDEVTPEWAGDIYCHLMAAFDELADIRRAAEWVDATTRWLATLPEAVLFTGICRVHRSQVLQTRGAWEQAEYEAVRVCEELATLHVVGAAEGHCQVGEIRRLRGDLTAAGEAYQKAHERGRDPQPGLALLRLAEGRLQAASASIRSALIAQPDDPLSRSKLLAAQVEIAVAASDYDEAEAACAELEEIAALFGTSGLEAAAAHARGALLLATRPSEEALPTLRRACGRWRELDAPYDAARACLLLAQAYGQLEDEDAAEQELDAAEFEFERLGAALDLAKLRALRGLRSPDGLTPRQVEVLALVGTGKSNRQIAAELNISEKTVARHLENIFTKLDLSSRAAAAVYAVEHRLASGPRG